jgi:serine/threonine-protein kinase
MNEPLPEGTQVANYLLLRPIGRGTQAVVYLAEDGRTHATVALKLVHLGEDDGDRGTTRKARELFLQNAETARRLVHPDIVTLFDFGVAGARGWLAMEPVLGGDLGRYTAVRRLLPEPVVLRVVQRAALALAYAHRAGVIHRDLKPANVLIDWSAQTVKLADFGLARTVDASQTGTGTVPGSPFYMAPEQLAGAVPSVRTDLYALGVMLFQLLTGRLPHEAPSMGELLRQVASDPAPDLALLRPTLPPELSALVAGLLAKRPTDRPADANAVAEVLRALAARW